MSRRRKLIFALNCLLWILPSAARAQQPFVTDNADVTGKGKFHLQFADEYDILQRVLYPARAQESASAEIDYGLLESVEVAVAVPLLQVRNARVAVPRTAFGFSDATVHVKYNFYKEREASRVPAMTVNMSVQFPTGDAGRQLGSGVTDYYLNGIAQKSLTKRTTFRLNGGMLFAGNTTNGALGIRTTRGRVFTSGGSFVRKFNDKLDLGAELTGAVTGNFQLSKGQLQALAGGNYVLGKNLTLDFAVVTGRFAASPRAGAQLGFSLDF